MKIGIVGLGKMGSGIATRLKKKYTVLGYDPKSGFRGVKKEKSIENLAKSLDSKSIIILSVPHDVIDDILGSLSLYVKEGTIIIDSGNSNYKESKRRYDELKSIGVDFLDAGFSGGPGGAKSGFSIMVGGDKKAYEKCKPVLNALSMKNGLGYFGGPGSGHFVKMVHNAIEYGMMQSIAEGLDLAANGPYEIDIEKLCSVWQNGSVIESKLVELSQNAFSKDKKMGKIKGHVDDSGEGRWAIQSAIEHDVPFLILSSSVFSRFRSRRKDNFADRILAALRREFGGHSVKKK